MIHPTTPTALQQNRDMQQYYRLQSKIYDATRWSFLFGRSRLIQNLPIDKNSSFRALEVGCGTGFNIRCLAERFPGAHITGMDISIDMIDIARRKTAPFKNRTLLIRGPYQQGTLLDPPVDLILFSYSLTMINPQWQALIRQSYQDLRPGGLIAVVDFHDSPAEWFKNHMVDHHVRMEGHLLPVLKQFFHPVQEEIRSAYGGIWRYFSFIGRK